MTRKVSNFSDLIQRVTASCLLNPLADCRSDAGDKEEEEEEYHSDSEGNKHEDDDDQVEEDEGENDDYGEGKVVGRKVFGEAKKLKQMVDLMEEVFEVVSAMKSAYVSLQEAHYPWDPQKVRVADVAVVAELRKLGVLRERLRRSTVDGKGRRRGGNAGGVASLREVVAPYEALMEELRKEVKAKDSEVQNLKEKLQSVVTLSSNGYGGEKKAARSQTRRKLGCSQIQGKERRKLRLVRQKI